MKKLLLSPIPTLLVTVLTCASGMISTVQAAESASGQISSLSLGGGLYDYTIVLNNTGTTSLETFWYSWVPGYNFMPASPSSVSPPAGWTDSITSSPGYAILFTTSTTPLAAGQSLDFSFDSTVTPAQMAGSSFGSPVGTSFVYSGAPFSDAGYEFVVQSVPEPSSVALLVASLSGLWFASRKYRS